MTELNFIRAITQAVDEEMARTQDLIIMGEDVRLWGAPRGDFKGLYEKYGPDRMLDTPISETAILGGAIGAAATGMRVIAHLLFVSFVGVCGDELLNQLTQMRYMLAGQVKVPVTIMCYFGAGFSSAAHHSKTLHGLLMCIPGLRIVVPSTPYDAKGLLKTAIRGDNPTIFLSHQMLIRRGMKQEVPDTDYTIPFGVADIKRKGKDVTVVATALMLHRALAAAEKLQESGISVEVIDPRTWVPFDNQAIIDSVKKTGKLVIMEEEPKTAGASAQVAAMVAEEAFNYLKAPIKRVCAPDTPIPFSPVMEKFWMPDEERLIKAVMELVHNK